MSNVQTKANKYMHLTNQIEDSLTNDLDSITIDKIRNFINEYDTITETLEYSYPTQIKNRITKRYKDKKVLPNALNCISNFVNITPPTTPMTNNNTDYIV